MFLLCLLFPAIFQLLGSLEAKALYMTLKFILSGIFCSNALPNAIYILGVSSLIAGSITVIQIYILLIRGIFRMEQIKYSNSFISGMD